MEEEQVDNFFKIRSKNLYELLRDNEKIIKDQNDHISKLNKENIDLKEKCRWQELKREMNLEEIKELNIENLKLKEGKYQEIPEFSPGQMVYLIRSNLKTGERFIVPDTVISGPFYYLSVHGLIQKPIFPNIDAAELAIKKDAPKNLIIDEADPKWRDL